MTGSTGHLAIRPLGRVLTATEAGLYHDAAAARDAALRESERIKHAIHERAASELKVARQALLREASEAAVRAEAQFAAGTTRSLAELEQAIAAAIAAGVERIVGSLGLDEAITRAARIAVRGLQDRVGLTIRVASDRVQAVTEGFSPLPEGLSIVGDAALDAADCLIETRGGFVRAGLGDQLEVLRQAFAGATQP